MVELTLLDFVSVVGFLLFFLYMISKREWFEEAKT